MIQNLDLSLLYLFNFIITLFKEEESREEEKEGLKGLQSYKQSKNVVPFIKV
jgi:hypothetical protein